MEFLKHPELTESGTTTESKWLLLDKIPKFWDEENVEEAILTLDPYWLEHMALAAHNDMRDFFSHLERDSFTYCDGKITLEDLYIYAKKHHLKCANEFIGMRSK